MVSRRNIRIKVLQSLYALRTGNAMEQIPPKPVDTKSKTKLVPSVPLTTAELLERQVRKHYQATLALFAYQVWFLTEVARYAESDARIRATKHIPSAEDLKVPVKIAGNELLWRMLESPFYSEAMQQFKPHLLDSENWVKKVYGQLRDSTNYQLYNQTEGRDKKAEKEIIEFIYNDLMLCDPDWTSFVEELFPNWADDADMLRLIMGSFLSKPGLFKMADMFGTEKEQFGIELAQQTALKKDYLDSIIEPKLTNWDADRLALLDILILQMGVCEFLYFETIPTKVTINEYIDIAKDYSTHQSGQFVNGILDTVRKDLESAEKINKVAYKK